MDVFQDVQKLVFQGGGIVKVTIPPSYSIQFTNDTDDIIYLYPNQSSRIAYPLRSGALLTIDNVTKSSTVYVSIKDSDVSDNKGFYILSRPWIARQNIEENNTNIFNSQ